MVRARMSCHLPSCCSHRRLVPCRLLSRFFDTEAKSVTGSPCCSYSNKYTVLDENGTTVALLAEDVGGIGDERTLLFYR